MGADRLMTMIPKIVKEKGIVLVITKVHETDSGFVVLRAEIIDIDLERMLESMKGDKISESHAQMIQPWLASTSRFVDLPAKIVPKVEEKMCRLLEERIPTSIAEKTGCLDVLLINRSTTEQAEFFFDAMGVHRFDVIVTVLNVKEALPKLIQKRIKSRWGSGPLRRAAGRVVSKVAGNSERVFARRAGAVMQAGLTEWLEDHGLGVEVTQTFHTKEGGTVILRCQIAAPLVDLPQFRKTGRVSKVSEDEHFLRLGHDGKNQVYHAMRAYIQDEYAQHMTEKSEGIITAQVCVADQSETNINPEMENVDEEEEEEADEQ